jgi:hypothetical protein
LDHREGRNQAMHSDTELIVRLNANIPRVLHKQAKTYALEHDLTLTEVVIQALTALIEKEVSPNGDQPRD